MKQKSNPARSDFTKPTKKVCVVSFKLYYKKIVRFIQLNVLKNSKKVLKAFCNALNIQPTEAIYLYDLKGNRIETTAHLMRISSLPDDSRSLFITSLPISIKKSDAKDMLILFEKEIAGDKASSNSLESIPPLKKNEDNSSIIILKNTNIDGIYHEKNRHQKVSSTSFELSKKPPMYISPKVTPNTYFNFHNSPNEINYEHFKKASLSDKIGEIPQNTLPDSDQLVDILSRHQKTFSSQLEYDIVSELFIDQVLAGSSVDLTVLERSLMRTSMLAKFKSSES